MIKTANKSAALVRESAACAWDVQRVRADFPILRQQVHGKPLVYLDNAATTQKPRSVIDAVTRYYERDNANIHRGVHTLSMRATTDYEDARTRIARFIGAARREEIVFVRGATEGVNLVAWSFVGPRLAAGDEIVISVMEHHSNIVPWQMLCERTGAMLRVVPINDDGELILEEYHRLLTPWTKFVAVAHVSNALGTINPVREIVEAAHARGIPVLLDGAQAAPHTKIDVAGIGCDFYVFSSHKMYGPTGVGAVYGRFDLLDAMIPYQGGGDMIKSVSFEKTIYNDVPHRFEAGTPDISGVIGFGAACDYLTALGIDRIEAYEQELLAYGTAALRSIPEVRLVGTARHKAAVLSFVVEGIHPHDVGTILDQEGVAVRTGHHCAQPVMDRFGIPGTARASLGIYNTREELDVLAAGLRQVIEVFR